MIAVRQMTVLFLLMIVGFFAFHKDILSEEVNKKISSIVVNIANPAMIISSVLGDNSAISAKDITLVILISIIFYVSLILLSFILPWLLRVNRSSRNTYSLMLVFSNIGFMGMPMIKGMVGEEGLLYGAIFLIPFNVLIYTYGVAMMQGEQKETQAQEEREKAKSRKKAWWKKIKSIFNLGVIACVVAIVIFAFQIPVPLVFAEFFDMLGDLTAPLSMLVIGASFHLLKPEDLLGDKRLIFYMLLKLLAVPIGGMALVTIFISNKVMLGVILIMLATPVASMVPMLAQEYGGDIETGTKAVAVSTLLSVFTIPIVSAMFL